MTEPLDSDIYEKWNRFIQELKLAKKYYTPYMLLYGDTFRNPIVENLLPSLLYVKIVTIFDEALDEYIRSSKIAISKKNKNYTLKSKIEILNDRGLIKHIQDINQIRNRRNDIAHDINQTSSWAEVDFALSVIEKELQHLGFVNDHPKYEFYMERSAIEFSKEPGILGTQSFSFGLKYKEQPVVEISWDKKLYRIDPNKAGLD